MAVSSTMMPNCSGQAVATAFERIITNHISKNRLIGPNNYFTRDFVERVKANKAAKIATKQKQAEEYIASSVIVHSSDGWAYLSRSVESLINGDISGAIHFAYYAELRSAMSLMAYEGIGIFNYYHVWFNATNSATWFDQPGTHKVADQCFRKWSQLPSKKAVIFNLLKVNNRSFEDWIRPTGISTKSKYLNSMVGFWLDKWSIDLRLDDDQDIRNEMSYRPHFEISPIEAQANIDKLVQIWELLEPTGANVYTRLDQHLLRITLEEVYRKQHSKEPTDPDFRRFITNIFNALGENINQSLFNFLLRLSDPSDAIIFEEAQKDTDINENKKNPLPIICRALLLLRISTGAANKFIADSSLDVNELRFWWENIALQHGLTTTNPSGIDAADLYADIRDSIDDLATITPGSLSSVKEAFLMQSGALFYLKQFERSGIWGLGL